MNKPIARLVLAGALALAGQPSHAIVFSVDPASTVPGVGPADLLQSFGGNAFTLVATAAQVGLLPGDDIDALHQGFPGSILTWMSVDRAATGTPGTAVRTEANAGEQSGDVFAALFLGGAPPNGNTLAADEQSLGLGPLDDLDAMYWLSFDASAPFFFSLAAGSPTLAALGASAADILVSAPGQGPQVHLTAAQLGLTAADDIDALDGGVAVIPGFPAQPIRYSLAPGSPSLGGASAADIFSSGGGSIPALQLGLNASDNLNALASTFDCSLDALAVECPEPATWMLMLAGLLGRRASRRRRDAE